MPDNSWRPDWKDWTQYPKPDDMNDLQFGWELLRRNTEYQELYDQYVDAMEFCKVDCSFIGAGMAARLCIAIATRFCLKEPIDYRRQFTTASELKELAANIEYVWQPEVIEFKEQPSISVPQKWYGIGAINVFIPLSWDEADQSKQLDLLVMRLNEIRAERMKCLEKVSVGLGLDGAKKPSRVSIDASLAKADASELNDQEVEALQWADFSCPVDGANRDQVKRWRIYLRRLDAKICHCGDGGFANTLGALTDDADSLLLSDPKDKDLRKKGANKVGITAKKYSEQLFSRFLQSGARAISVDG